MNLSRKEHCLYIGVEKGKTAPVDSILAIVGKKGEDITAPLDGEKSKPAPAAEAPQAEAPVAKTTETPAADNKAAEPKKEEPAKATVAAPAAQTPAPKVTTSMLSKVNNEGRSKVSPLAKKLAGDKNINLSLIRGTGDGGRVIKRDIENYEGGMIPAILEESYTDEPVSQMRKTIARRLAESKFSAPHFYLTMEIEMDEMMKAREAINQLPRR